MSDLTILEKAPFAENAEPRCACVLVLDTSGSMQGAPIAALNLGIKAFGDAVKADAVASRRVETAIITFDSEVRVIQDFVTMNRYEAPTLSVNGVTKTGTALLTALDLIEARKSVYRKVGVDYYRPWILLITDGEPQGDSDETLRLAATRVRTAESEGKVAVFAVGVEGVNTARLAELTVRAPLSLDGLDFSSLFLWLSASMASVSRSRVDEKLALPPPGWASI